MMPETPPRRRGRPATDWTPAMDAALIRARDEGCTMVECGARVGVCHATARRRLTALGRPVDRVTHVRWNRTMDDALIRARVRGLGIHRCADIIGVDKSVLARRLTVLGLPRTITHGAVR